MKKGIIILGVFMLVACTTKNVQKTTDTIDSDILLDKVEISEEQITSRFSYKNVLEIITDTLWSVWVERKDSSASLALHFMYKDILAVAYSAECWLYYPYKIDNNKIVVYWDNKIDTKYNFDIVKAINKTDRKYLGMPFMILELENDTTFKATYPLKELVRKINNSSKNGRIFFPDKYIVVQDDFL